MRKDFLACLVVGLAIMLGVLWRTTNKTQAAAPLFDRDTQDARAVAQEKGLAQLARYAQENGYYNLEQRVAKVEIDDLNMAHTRVQQTVNGVPVWGGEAIVHLRKDGSLFTVTDNLVKNVFVDTTPTLSEKVAVEMATSRIRGGREVLTAEPVTDLWVWAGKDETQLVYRVQLRREDGTAQTSMPVYFINAHTGAKVFSYDNLQTQSATGSGVSLYSGTVPLNTYKSGTTFYLEDVGRKVGTFNYNNGTSTAARYSDADNVWDSAIQKAGVDAQYGAIKTYDYFLNVHGRNGIDGSGGPGATTSIDGTTRLITSRVHYSSNYNNAFWNGSYMTYGDGNGTTFSPLVTLDIAGHEMTHGVTERTANLTYANESGALNESMSDVFGAMVERSVQGESANTWKIGEQCYTPSNGTGDALRYMDNPHLASNSGYTSDDDPDHYAERYTGSGDNGGVHINSGIANYAFYLAAKGGTHHRSGVTVTGMGADDAAKIWYRALTSYMTASTNFAGARTATLNAATVLFGATSTQYARTCAAWTAVGVGTACTAPTPTPTPTATPTPTPTPTPGANLLTNGNFEAAVAPWVVSGTGVTYTANGSPAQSGTGFVSLGNINSAAGQIYQQFTIPSTATSANLRFWLNIASAETTTSTQYDRLFVEVRNSSGTLLTTLATYSNLNKGTSYVQRGPFSLLAYKGQTVRVQFRTTTDSSLTTNFRVDTAAVQ